MKTLPWIRVCRGRVAALLMLACLPLVTGCNPAFGFAYMLDWGALIIFAPLRSAFGALSLDLVNSL